MTIMTTSSTNTLYADHLSAMLARIHTALDRASMDGILIASGEPRTAFLDDIGYPFRINPHFKSLVPLTDVPGSFILIRKGVKPRLFYCQPQDYWHLPPSLPEGDWTRHWQITAIESPKDMHNLLGPNTTLAFIGEDEALGRRLGIDHINPGLLLAELHYARACKTPYEIDCMRRANMRAVAGHRAALRAFNEGSSEFDIQASYLAATREREQQSPYSNIVALNEHGAVLHYQHYELEPPAEHRSLLIDAGAGHQGYAADVTRTYARPGTEFESLVERMDQEQQAIIGEIRCGMNYADLHLRMHERIAQVLIDAELTTSNAEQLIESNTTFTFMPHGLGHLIGLQTHDVGGFQQNPAGDTQAPPDRHPALRLTRPIEEGQVFTIEPGLYFIPMLLEELRASPAGNTFNWDRIAQLKPFGGIRIEDNIAMIDSAPVNLTRQAFAAVAA